MYAAIDLFLEDWKKESEATLRVLTRLTDASLSQRVGPEGRTLGFLSWHLVLTLGEMGGKAGLEAVSPPEDSPEPALASEIVTAYEEASRSLAQQIGKGWRDDMLRDEIPMYGSTWRRGDILDSLVHHQIHHRGQMTVLMRQAGLVVPGIYGPAREEWAKMGMQPMR
jgi:uncharacterized damage-inducible protein DinB